jgi:hypothetical protein
MFRLWSSRRLHRRTKVRHRRALQRRHRQPLTLASRYILGWLGEGAIIRGSAWLLAGITTLLGEARPPLAIRQPPLLLRLARRGRSALLFFAVIAVGLNWASADPYSAWYGRATRHGQHHPFLILITPLIGALLIALLPTAASSPHGSRSSPRSSPSASPSTCPRTSPTARAASSSSDIPWIAIPAIHYHVGVDGLSLWLVVLTGLLAPIGVLASWKTIQDPQQSLLLLFLVQQTAMLGVFVSLDLMLYYGFWELSLVPMAILIAMYGRASRERGPKPPSASSSTPSSHRRRCSSPSSGSTPRPAASTSKPSKPHRLQLLPAGALCWAPLAFLIAFAVKVPVLGLHGWLPTRSPKPRRHGHGRRRQARPLLAHPLPRRPLPRPGPPSRALAHRSRSHRHPLRRALALVQKDFWKLLAYGTISSLSFCTLGIYGFTLAGLDGSVFQTSTKASSAPRSSSSRRPLRPLRHQPDQSPTAASPKHPRWSRSSSSPASP